MGGIATALRVAGAINPRAVLVVACDMPALAGKAVDLLLARRRADRPASALRNPLTGRLEPLAAVYEPSILENIEQAMADGAFRVTQMLESAGAHGIEVPPELTDQITNVNTPAELEAIQDHYG